MSSSGFDTLPAGASNAIKPWKVNIPQESLDELKYLLKRSRLAPPTYENSLPEGQDRRLGVRHDWLSAAKKHWEDGGGGGGGGGFDWREKEEYINTFPHFKAQIHDDSLDHDFEVHFVGMFSKRENAIPIVLIHGWPGSFVEFLPMLELLRSRYGTADDLPYHLIVPSLPGYTFSSAPPLNKNFTVDDAARIFDRLVSRELGLTAYIAQGGDVGARVARALAAQHTSCKAAHLNTAPMPAPDASKLRSPISELEQRGIERGNEFVQTGSAYAMEHATRPSTIGFVLSSSPLALLAWIGEKMMDWTDDDPSLDVVLESVSSTGSPTAPPPASGRTGRPLGPAQRPMPPRNGTSTSPLASHGSSTKSPRSPKHGSS